VLDAVLESMDDVFDGLYAAGGRSVPRGSLLKATVLTGDVLDPFGAGVL
jgi:hypothetical protein